MTTDDSLWSLHQLQLPTIENRQKSFVKKSFRNVIIESLLLSWFSLAEVEIVMNSVSLNDFASAATNLDFINSQQQHQQSCDWQLERSENKVLQGLLFSGDQEIDSQAFITSFDFKLLKKKHLWIDNELLASVLSDNQTGSIRYGSCVKYG